MEEKSKNEDISALIADARELIAEDMDSEALLRLRKIIKVEPDNVEALLLYAQVSPSKDNAKSTLNKVLSLDPGNAEARLLLKRVEKEIEQESTQSATNNNTPAPSIQIVNNLDNSNANSAAASIGGMGVFAESENRTALWLGFFAALFGFYGVAHLINGKIGSGLLHLVILGPILLTILFLISATGIGLIVSIPGYFLCAWRTAKSGAQNEPKLVPYRM